MEQAIGADGGQALAELVEQAFDRITRAAGTQGDEGGDGQDQGEHAGEEADQRLPAVQRQAEVIQQPALAVAVVGQQQQVPLVGDAIEVQQPAAPEVGGGAAQRTLLRQFAGLERLQAALGDAFSSYSFDVLFLGFPLSSMLSF